MVSIPVFLGITVIVFVFIALAPGSIVDALLRPELGYDPAAEAAIIRRYGLDQPLHIRYIRWLANSCRVSLATAWPAGLP